MVPMNPVITIKLHEHQLGEEDLENLRRWENEGGTPTLDDAMISSVTLPLRPGQVFEVVRGEVRYEEGGLVYEAELNLLSLS